MGTADVEDPYGGDWDELGGWPAEPLAPEHEHPAWPQDPAAAPDPGEGWPAEPPDPGASPPG